MKETLKTTHYIPSDGKFYWQMNLDRTRGALSNSQKASCSVLEDELTALATPSIVYSPTDSLAQPL